MQVLKKLWPHVAQILQAGSIGGGQSEEELPCELVKKEETDEDVAIELLLKESTSQRHMLRLHLFPVPHRLTGRLLLELLIRLLLVLLTLLMRLLLREEVEERREKAQPPGKLLPTLVLQAEPVITGPVMTMRSLSSGGPKEKWGVEHSGLFVRACIVKDRQRSTVEPQYRDAPGQDWN